MPKKRVNELAKEIGVSSKNILDILLNLDISARTHSNNLEEGEQERIKQYFNNKKSDKILNEKEVKTTIMAEIEISSVSQDKPKDIIKEDKPVVTSKQTEAPSNSQDSPPAVSLTGASLSTQESPKQRLATNERPRARNYENRPPRLGPDGKPLPPRPRLDADGKPIPRQPRLDANGNPIPRQPRMDANGNPMRPRNYDNRPPRLGPDGKPLPPRPRLDANGKPLPPRPPRLDANGNPIPRQPRLDANGNPIPRQPRMDANGNPMRPRNYDNRPPRLGPDGKPLPRTDGQYKQQRQDGQRYETRPERAGNDNRAAQDNRGQKGFQNRQAGGFGQNTRTQSTGGFKQEFKPDFNKQDNRGQRPAPKNNNQKTVMDIPDKHGRRQKIEASSRATKGKNKFDRTVDEKAITRTHIKKAEKLVKPAEPKVLQVPAFLTLKELAEYMNTSGSQLVKSLMKKGEMITITQEISFEKAEEIALDYNFLLERKLEIDILEEVFAEDIEDEEQLKGRPPIVVVMGHVDHGKTSLLDAIRRTDVVHDEAGGITQHIGAYTVNINDRSITFLDTPGHEAFTAMRMRGAQVTDIAILVVAADDGVMPQTIEAISHAKAAGVEIVVAINKIDKPSANQDRVMQELTEHGLISEAWGGDTICVPVSAATREGIDSLLEMVLLIADMKEYKANPNKRAKGTVIESELDKGRGPVATVLVQAGTLEVGDPIVAGTAFGRIRAMIDDKGRKLKKAGPSIPVEILGLATVPTAGDLFHIAKNEKEARHVAETITAKNRIKLIDETPQRVSLEDLFTQIKEGKVKDLNIIIKADVQGSVEAVKQSLEKLSNDEVRIRTILGGVGAVTESDVMLASASNAIIIGFNVRPEASAKSVAIEQQVDIRLYRVIYNAIDDIEAAMKGMLDPIYEEKVIGHAQIRQLFKVSGIGTIGGGYVTDGKITRNSQVRILRDNVVVYEGSLDTLRRFKEDVREVSTNYECGLLFSKFNDIKEGDVVEAFVMEEIKR